MDLLMVVYSETTAEPLILPFWPVYPLWLLDPLFGLVIGPNRFNLIGFGEVVYD